MEETYKIKLISHMGETIVEGLTKESVDAFKYAVENNTHCIIIDNEKESIYYPSNYLLIMIFLQ